MLPFKMGSCMTLIVQPNEFSSSTAHFSLLKWPVHVFELHLIIIQKREREGNKPKCWDFSNDFTSFSVDLLSIDWEPLDERTHSLKIVWKRFWYFRKRSKENKSNSIYLMSPFLREFHTNLVFSTEIKAFSENLAHKFSNNKIRWHILFVCLW